jgi:hypothetical protein
MYHYVRPTVDALPYFAYLSLLDFQRQLDSFERSCGFVDRNAFVTWVKGGPAPDAFAKYWITYPGDATETLLSDVKGKNMMATAEDDVIYDFAFFSGGASPAYSPEHDSFARHGGIRYWSGEEYWAEGNGAGGGTGEGGGTTPPNPPAGSFTINMGGEVYNVSGSWTLKK